MLAGQSEDEKLSPVRVLIAPVEIAGYYSQLTLGLRIVGYRVTFVTRSQHPFGYSNSTPTPRLVKVARSLSDVSRPGNRRNLFQWIRLIAGDLVWSLWSLMAIFRNDVFVFAFGQSLLRYNLDLPLLRLLNKRVIANLAHGSEARPPYMDGYREFDVANSAGVVDLYRRTCENSRRVGLFERYADVVIGAPFSTSQFASRPFVNSFALGLPSVHNPREEGSNSSRSDSPGKIGDTVKEKSIVLHAPSNMRAKGTKHIRKVVAELNRAGGNVELHEIHGKSNQEVLNALRAADFIVDQLYSDTPLAGFASEAASVGKPSVVGGYGLERLEPFIPSELRTASYTCQPEDLLRAITDLADDPARVQRLGAAAQAFVESEWTCTKVATRFLCLIEDRVPMEWYLDPQEIVYVEGACQPKWVTRERIRSLVDHFGVDALCVTHNPQLLTALLKFAFESGRENMND